MLDELRWLIGAVMTLITVIGGIVVRDREVMRKIDDGDARLSERITKVQTEYARKEDLTDHILRVEQSVESMRNELRETNRRIDSLILVLSNFMERSK